MILRHYRLLLGLLVLCFVGSTGSTTSDILYWSDDYRLNWSDFAGDPRYDYESISALTSSGIVHYKGCKDGKIIYKVQAYFERKESWVKAEALTRHHLEHEQIHFDITELYARKLRKVLSQQNFVCGQEEEFETFVGNFLKNWEMMQQAYDGASRHSLDEAKQKAWFHRVAMEMSLLDEFESPVKEEE